MCQEIVSELFRLQPGTPLNFSDLASTEKALSRVDSFLRLEAFRLKCHYTFLLPEADGSAEGAKETNKQ